MLSFHLFITLRVNMKSKGIFNHFLIVKKHLRICYLKKAFNDSFSFLLKKIRKSGEQENCLSILTKFGKGHFIARFPNDVTKEK